MLHVKGQMEPANDESNTTKMLLRIFVLGPLTIEWEGHHPPFPPERMSGRGAAKALGLLKALLSQADRFAMRDWLMEQFWPESAISSAQERLDDVASGLRTLLRPPGSSAKILQYVHGSDGKGSGYRLEGYPLIWVDADAFAWYVEQAARLDRFGDDSLPCWERAYQLGARGLFLPEERYSDWPQARRAQVEGQYRQCMHRLTTLLRERGAKEQALLRLRSYWQAHPTDEDVLRPLMELLGEQERYQEAEDDYQQLLLTLAEQGSDKDGHPREPDEHTRDLREYLRAKQLRRSPGQEALMKRSKEERSASSSAAQQQTRVVEATGYPLSDDQRLLQMADEHSERTGSLDAETRHLLGRQEWLASVLALIQAEIPKKLLVLHGPIGVGKSSEMNRLAHSFREQNASPFQVLVLPLPSGERHDPEAALDLFVGMILSESRAVPFPADASRQMRITLALTTLAQRRQPTVILLDNAEGTLTEEGTLAPCWEAFLACCVRGQHQATFVLATKEWPGWSGRDSQLVAEIAVPPLTLEDSVLLLQRLGLESVPRAALEMISQRVACIPLCLEWIATIAHDPLVHDEWEGFDEQEESGTESRLDAIAQRLVRLLHHPTLLGEHLASRLTPLLEHIMEKHLSTDARRVLEHLALVTIPLATPALQVLCPRPALLKELRDVSLLAAYTNRVQLLPVVAFTIQQQLAPEQRLEVERVVIRAYSCWLERGNLEIWEAGSVVTELAVLLLKHHRLLEAAEVLIRHGWLSFKLGNAPRLALLAEGVKKQFDWQASIANTCGGKLLHYFLTPYLGRQIEVQQRREDYYAIRDAIFAEKVVLNPHVEIFLTHYLLMENMDELRFEEAHELLRVCCRHLEALQSVQIDVRAALLEKQGMVLSRWCEYTEEQGEKETARVLRERAIAVYEQSTHMLATYVEASPLKNSRLKRWQAHALNFLGYHLYRMGHYKEALHTLLQSTTLQEQGYAARAGLPPCYGDISLTLAALGRFQEALQFDEKAAVEAQRIAELGHIASQEDIWIYHVNRGCLYLRLGRINEAEQLLQEALPHISPHRRMYRMFAKEALEEIEQWRRTSISPQHQLDWRWVERYRALASFDSYWWLAPAGPFTDEEQREWERLFTHTPDEATKERLGTLMSRSTRREVQAAMAEQREPQFSHPVLDIEAVRMHIAGLIQLDQEIAQEEPNAIVRRLYHETIEEEMDYLRLIEATYERNSEHFWEYNLRTIPTATPEEMRHALRDVRWHIIQGLQHPEMAQASERLIEVLREECGISFDLSCSAEEARELHNSVPLSLPSHSHMVSARAVKQFFETVLQQGGFDGWHVVIDPNAGGARIEQGLRRLFLPDRSVSVIQIKHLLAHELACHAARCVAGERSLLGLLGIHTKNSLETEEGIAAYYDIQEEKQQHNGQHALRVWPGTLATGFASGVVTPPQTFLSLLTFFEAFFFLRRLLQGLDSDTETAKEKARQAAMTRCLRTYRGMPDLERAGICFTQDAIYLRGLWTMKRAYQEDRHVFDRLAVGVVAVEQLPDLQELGIISAPQPLRTLVENPQLDDYILAFEEAGKDISRTEDRKEENKSS